MYYSLSYSQFVVPLVKAVQELSQKNDTLKMMNTEKDERINNLEERITKLENTVNLLTQYNLNNQKASRGQSSLTETKPVAVNNYSMSKTIRK